MGRKEEAGSTEDFEIRCGFASFMLKMQRGVRLAQGLTPAQAGAGFQPKRLHQPWDPALGPRFPHTLTRWLLSEFPRLFGCPQMYPSEGPEVGISWPFYLVGHSAQGPLYLTLASVPALLKSSQTHRASVRRCPSRPLSGA